MDTIGLTMKTCYMGCRLLKYNKKAGKNNLPGSLFYFDYEGLNGAI